MNRMASAVSLASYNKIYLSADNVVTWSFAWCPNEDVPLRGQSPGRKVRPPPVCAWGSPAQGSHVAQPEGRAGQGRAAHSWLLGRSFLAPSLAPARPVSGPERRPSEPGLCHWP